MLTLQTTATIEVPRDVLSVVFSATREGSDAQAVQALERAAKRAYSLAAETGTSVIVLSNGILEEIHPDAATALLQEPSTPYRREK